MVTKKKIYIVGVVGSGKTTFAKKLANKYDISYYELDKVVWDDDNGNRKRNELERDSLFKEIINSDEWIIEDVGRKCFSNAIKEADIVYYIKLNRFVLYFRVIKRWLKQKFGWEGYNYKPTLNGLFQMFLWLRKGLKEEKEKIKHLENDSKKLFILDRKKVNDLVEAISLDD